MSKVYPYASGSLLEERNTYTYTPYLGQELLKAWRANRQAAIDGLCPASSPPPPRSEMIKGKQDEYTTGVVLEELMHCLHKERSASMPFQLLKLVQRFEVTKRIHACYNSHWRAVDKGDYRNLPLYIRFAEVLESAYSRAARLDFLNCYIKCLDTLVALRAELGPELQARLSWLLSAELAHVAKLEAEVEGRNKA